MTTYYLRIDYTKARITRGVEACHRRGLKPGIPKVVFRRGQRHTPAEAIELLEWLEATYPAIYAQVRANFPNF